MMGATLILALHVGRIHLLAHAHAQAETMLFLLLVHQNENGSVPNQDGIGELGTSREVAHGHLESHVFELGAQATIRPPSLRSEKLAVERGKLAIIAHCLVLSLLFVFLEEVCKMQGDFV